MSIKKSKPKNPNLLLDENGQRYTAYRSKKTYASRKGKLISMKELKRRELQRAKDLGLDDVNILEVSTKSPVVNVGTLVKPPFWIRVAAKLGAMISRLFKRKSHGEKSQG